MIDLSTLFESQPARDSLGSLKDELEAVRSRKKGMSVFSFPRSETGGDNYKELLTVASQLGLLTVHQNEHVLHTPERDIVYIFVLHPEESWRVPAYILTRKCLRTYAWSDGAEYLESALLGYNEEEISFWLKRKHQTRVSWTGLTIYVLLSRQQQTMMTKLGMRCIDPDTLIEPITVFHMREHMQLKKDAIHSIPANMVIGRVSVKQAKFLKLFEHTFSSAEPLIIATLSADDVASINPALDSNFEFLDVDGWR
jgi:hypothetical protein